MTDNSITVYLSEGALAQKRCYHTDPDGCQSITNDESPREVTKEVAEDELGLRICSHCADSVDQEEEHDQRLNAILKEADPSDGWDGVREKLSEAKADV